MKNVAELKQELTELIISFQEGEITEKKFKPKCEKLKQNILYLETTPSIEFLKSEKERLSKIIESKLSQFNEWAQNAPEAKSAKNPMLVYKNQMGIPAFKRQLANINSLLS
jgi:ribosomal protein L29